MSGVFLSYRRADSDFAVLLYAWLAERFGPSQVFWDREDIAPGTEFEAVLRRNLEESGALIALIGPGWTPSRWIAFEIGHALRKRACVLPVLTGDVKNLAGEDLPRPIRRLAKLETLETGDLRFRDRLVAALEPFVAPRPEPPAREDPRTRRFSDLLRRQAARLQSRALELISEQKAERAIDELNEGFELLMALAEFSPGDIQIDLLLGYLYKDLAQAFEASGGRRQADRYIELARSVFERVEAGASDAADTAGALNGIGNVYHQRGQPERAIPYYRRAVALAPSYGYAWHDLFAAYDLLARGGHPDLPAMREALGNLKTVAAGYPGIDMGQLEAALRHWEGRGKAGKGR